jgi:mannose-1-phosphate guanylyltransferase / phosphomannomutase
MSATRAVVLIDRDPMQLVDLLNGRHPAMLTIGNKPLVLIAMEEIHQIGIRNVTLVFDGLSSDLRQYVGNGEQWGLRVDWISRSQLSGFLRRQAGHEKLLMLRGDMLRPFGILQEALRREAYQQSANIYHAMGIDIRPEPEVLDANIQWSEILEHCNLGTCVIANLDDFHQANMLAVQNLVPGVFSAGRESKDSLTIGRGSRVNAANAVSSSIAIGVSCTVERHVTLGKNLVIGDNCFIASGSKLENAVILPDTYVGPGTSIIDKVVAPQWVYCINRKTHWIADDKRLVSAH